MTDFVYTKITHSSPHMTVITTHVVLFLAVLKDMVADGGTVVVIGVISTVARITMDTRLTMLMV